MIEVRFHSEDGTLTASLRGHAGAGRKGRDLVCAAASALAETLARAVQAMEEAGMLRNSPTTDLKAGYAEISAEPKPEFRTEVQMVFWTAEMGFGALAEGYSGNVRMEEVLGGRA